MTKQDNSKPQTSVAPAAAAAPSSALGPAPPSGSVAPAAPEPDAPGEPRSRDGLIVASIAVVAVAVAVMCHSQLQLSLQLSGVAGVVTLALLMLIHKQMQKSAQIAQLKAELAQTRQPVRPRPVSRVVVPKQAPGPAPVTSEARIRELSRDIGKLAPRPDVGQSQAASPEQPAAAPEFASRGPRPSVRSAPEIAAIPTSDAMPDAVSAGFGAPPSEAVREQWAFRPRTDAQASVQEASAAATGGSREPQGSVATTVEGDLELVQRKIKELADEVNAAEALRPRPQLVNPRPTGPTTPLEDSIGALKAAAKSMRGRPSLGDFIPKFEVEAPPSLSEARPEPANGGLQDLVIPATAERIAGSDPGSAFSGAAEREMGSPSLELPFPDFNPASSPELPPHVVAIAGAIEREAIDIVLGPIVTLAQHSVSHYEMGVNLRSAAGDALDYNEDDFPLIGGDLDSRFDIGRLKRAAALAARMDAREREGSLLASFFGSSMTSRAFLETFANVYETRQRISAQLVLTFSQRAVDAFSPSAWQAVRDMHAFGFRFALDDVRHMGTDFAALQRSGFRFVRMDAQALLDGMAAPDRFVPAEEILQRATLAGLSIIAGGIVDASTQKRLLDAGVQLGQGALFGAPRPVNLEGGNVAADRPAAA